MAPLCPYLHSSQLRRLRVLHDGSLASCCRKGRQRSNLEIGCTHGLRSSRPGRHLEQIHWRRTEQRHGPRCLQAQVGVTVCYKCEP